MPFTRTAPRLCNTLIATAALCSMIGAGAAHAMDGTATMIDANGQNIGSANITQTASGVTRITISVTGLPKGWHGFHVHETGQCNAEDGFKSAGGHLAGGREHGINVEGGPHPGDLPNQMVQESGVLVAEVFTERLNVSEEGEAAVFDADGSAFILHSGADDYESQPSGAAGSRIACGVIEKK